jgi:linoleoyl-CoA desaturase
MQNSPIFHKDFNVVLRKKVKAYFRASELSERGGKSIAIKSILIIGTLLTAYTCMLVFGHGSRILLITFFLLTLAAQLTASLAVMHDASHQSLFRKRWLNTFVVHLLLSLGGGSASIWRAKHVAGHHGHTNVNKKDSDIEGQPLFVFSPYQKTKTYHRYQYLYAIFFYCLLTIKWVLFDDIRDLIVNAYSMSRKKRWLCWAEVIFTRLLYLGITIVIPTFIFGSLIKVLLFWFVYNALFGLGLALVFQCAHVNTKTTFYPEKADSKLNFSIQQLQSTADFATKNRLFTWLVGGLNFQVIHHLFPAVCHQHYPAIQKILLEVMEDYPTLIYHQSSTFYAALKDHFRFLKMVASRQNEFDNT